MNRSTSSAKGIPSGLAEQIEKLYDSRSVQPRDAFNVFEKFITLLDNGEIRAAEPANGTWVVHEWVKKGILLGFRLGMLKRIPNVGNFSFYDKHTFPLKKISRNDNIRVVPGGSAVRKGAYVAPGVVVMPPAYINIGAYVGKDSMIDSHALVGSCAQIGARVHISAAAQIGGVLEPVGALPVIIEDGVLVGGNSGIYEGAIVKRGAVIGAGVVLTASTPVYDCIKETVMTKTSAGTLIIPEHAVVVPGARALSSAFARTHGLSLSTPLIVKYRDEKTDARTALEELLR
ncbi:MAG: 2,3,4,5-tetrahydropyridine-2,6-dicarboxylate N-succinyltransferase [Bacteroidota bacterium]|nr:2,3,4,5-tetrahydropyridine-2,6-dicarboxylate N-succinyltransferase [Bacteroidota bacterium]